MTRTVAAGSVAREVTITEVHDGRITAERHYLELLEFMAQVGLLGGPDSA